MTIDEGDNQNQHGEGEKDSSQGVKQNGVPSVRQHLKIIEDRHKKLDTLSDATGGEFHATDVSRPRGAVTKSDRDWLLGNSDVEPKTQHERVVRGRIRDRTANAITDIALLSATLSDRDREQIAEKVPQETVQIAIELLRELK